MIASKYARPTTHVGTWESTQHGATTRRRYRYNGATRGFCEEIGMFAIVATVFDANNRRHQRCFRDSTEARTWVQENVQ